jgi:4-oxalocrotonate tautomerase
MSWRSCGRVSRKRRRLAEAITKSVMDILHHGDESVSVAMEGVSSRDWAENVFKPDIQAKWNNLYKKPGYDLNDL